MKLRDLIPTPRDLPDIEVRPTFSFSENWKGDWRVAVETALEAIHVPHVHPETLAKFGLAESACEMDALGSRTIFDFPEAMRRQLSRLSSLFGDPPRLGDYVSIHAFPDLFITSTFGLTYSVQRFAPGPWGTVDFTTRDYAVARVSDAYLAAHETFSRRVHEEDRLACERVPRYHDHGALLPGEHRLRHFRLWLLQTGSR